MEHAAEEAIQHNEDEACTSEHLPIVYIHVIIGVQTHAVLVFVQGYRSTWFHSVDDIKFLHVLLMENDQFYPKTFD